MCHDFGQIFAVKDGAGMSPDNLDERSRGSWRLKFER